MIHFDWDILGVNLETFSPEMTPLQPCLGETPITPEQVELFTSLLQQEAADVESSSIKPTFAKPVILPEKPQNVQYMPAIAQTQSAHAPMVQIPSTQMPTAQVSLKDPTVSPNNWPRVAYYCWDSNNAQQCGNWPGTVVTDTRMVHGEKFYYKTFTITGSQYCVNFVFSQGGSTAGSHQTVDVTGVRQTAFFEVTTQTNKYQVSDVTADYLPYLDEEPLMGDVDRDGELSVSDVTLLIDYLLGIPGIDLDLVAADMDGDDEISINDVTTLIDILLGI